MKKWMHFMSPLLIVFIFLSLAFNPSPVRVPKELLVTEPTDFIFPVKRVFQYKYNDGANEVEPPYLGSAFVGFKEALAFKESQGNYFTMNTLGYLGKYQFGKSTLELMGVDNVTHFLNDPILQERAFETNIARNKWILRKDIKRFVGKRLRGVQITESGILAAAHLAGPGNVKKYLRSWGRYDVNDAYGTNMKKYMRKFSGYDVSYVAPKRNPRIL